VGEEGGRGIVRPPLRVELINRTWKMFETERRQIICVLPLVQGVSAQA